MITQKLFYCMLTYLFGSILFSELAMQLLHKKSLTAVSANHNPGVSNAYIYGGKLCCALAVIGDLAKGILPVLFYSQIFGQNDIYLALVMLAAALGHAWPFFFHFRGGICITVTFGALLGLLPNGLPVLTLAGLYIAFVIAGRENSSVFSEYVFFIFTIVSCIYRILGLIDSYELLGICLLSALVSFRMWSDLTTNEQKEMKIEMKQNLENIITTLIVVILAIMGIRSGMPALSAAQLSTLQVLLIVCICSMLYCFIVGELTQNFSQMDKLWSLLPIVYTWIIAIRGGFKPRLLFFAVIVTLWGLRLTINFARKGAYKLKFWEGKEDYRWSIVHHNPLFSSKFAWSLFNLLFISVYQNLLVLAICLPALASMDSIVELNIFDRLAGLAALLFLLLETAADESQWKFYETRKKLLAEKGSLDKLPMPYSLGFNTTGPWARMRHPNYLGEQGIWCSLYFFAVGAKVTNGGMFHWTILGPLLLIFLFMGSSWLGESISSAKYPRYKDYTEQVNKYLPLHKFHPEATKDETVSA